MNTCLVCVQSSRILRPLQNKQCDVALNSALESRPLSSPPKELSADGKKIVNDLREVIIQAKRLFIPKNEGELLQEFIWEAQHIGGAAMQQPDGPAVEKDTLRQDMNEAFEGMKTLGTLLITNGEFRKLRKLHLLNDNTAWNWLMLMVYCSQ